MASNGSVSTTQTTPTITTAANGDGIYAALAGTETGFGNVTAVGGTGATFTLRNADTSQNMVFDSSAIQASVGNVNATFTLSSAQTYMTAIVAFKAAGGAAQVPYQPYFQQMLASRRKPTIGWKEGYDNRWRRWRRLRGVIVPDRRVRCAA
jgi:hypothetical protein